MVNSLAEEKEKSLQTIKKEKTLSLESFLQDSWVELGEKGLPKMQSRIIAIYSRICEGERHNSFPFLWRLNFSLVLYHVTSLIYKPH